MRERDSLKNFCSVNNSLKSLICFAQIHNVSNIDTNGNKMETLRVCTGQIRHFANILLNKQVFQRVALSHIRLVLLIHSNFEK